MAMSTVFYIALGICAILMSSTEAESRVSDECCPTFWTPFGETCYRVISKPETWADAEAKCQQLGNGIIPGVEGHLVSIHSQDESDFVQTYYESSVGSSAIVQGRRKKLGKNPIKPNSYNSLWLGLNNQGPDLDTFVWSDKTQISTTFWQDTLYGKNRNCGHTWTSLPSNKGKWNDASCGTKLPYICKLVPTQQEDKEVIDELSVSYTSSGALPCSFRGTIILRGDTWTVDDCTVCYCAHSSTFRCFRRTCLPTSCANPVKREGECCSYCPDDKNVTRMSDLHIEGVGLNSVKADTVNDIRVQLQVLLPDNAQNVSGSSFWKVSMWASKNSNGSGKKIGFEEQVLTRVQVASIKRRPLIYNDNRLLIPGINFSLDATNTTCKEIQYLCASLDKGDAPETQLESRPESAWESHVTPSVNDTRNDTGSDVYDVEFIEISIPNPTRRVACNAFDHCKDKGQ